MCPARTNRTPERRIAEVSHCLPMFLGRRVEKCVGQCRDVVETTSDKSGARQLGERYRCGPFLFPGVGISPRGASETNGLWVNQVVSPRMKFRDRVVRSAGTLENNLESL